MNYVWIYESMNNAKQMFICLKYMLRACHSLAYLKIHFAQLNPVSTNHLKRSQVKVVVLVCSRILTAAVSHWYWWGLKLRFLASLPGAGAGNLWQIWWALVCGTLACHWSGGFSCSKFDLGWGKWAQWKRRILFVFNKSFKDHEFL